MSKPARARGGARGAGKAGKLNPVVILALLALVLMGGMGQIAIAAQGGAAAAPVAAEPTADFDACVRLALEQSPFLTKSALEIDVRKLDETDSKHAFIPAVSFRTKYYLNRPHQANLNPRAYSLEFVTDDYNPLVAYFSLKVHKLLTRIAVLGHLQVIAKGLQRLGQAFLELEALEQLAARQEELVDLARQQLTYVRKRQELGEVLPLEVRVAGQEVETALAEKERLAAALNRLQENLRAFLALTDAQKVKFAPREARRQVLGRFDAAAATREQARERSYLLKIQNLKQELQSWNITLAKVKLLPSFFGGVQTPDPLSQVDARGFYFSAGVSIPVWDGFKRFRNIGRQRTILKQYESEGEMLGAELGGEWLEARERLQSAAAALKLARTQEELAGLKARQAEIRYHSGGEPLPVWLEGRKTLLEARKNTLAKTLEHDLALLGLRRLSGDLSPAYVDDASYQK